MLYREVSEQSILMQINFIFSYSIAILKVKWKTLANIPMPSTAPIATPLNALYVASGTTAPITTTVLLTADGWDLII